MTSTTIDYQEQKARKREQQHEAARRALARARVRAAKGVRPILRDWLTMPEQSQTTWEVPSRGTAGASYTVVAVADCGGIHTYCTCKASETAQFCHHRSLARLAALGEIEYIDGRQEQQGEERQS